MLLYCGFYFVQRLFASVYYNVIKIILGRLAVSVFSGVIRVILLVCAVLGFGVIYAQNPQQPNDKIDEAYIDKALHSLIYGVSCDDKSDTPKVERIIVPPKNAITASNNATIDSANYPDSRMRKIVFNGEVLHGGIYEQNFYFSADRKFSYALKVGDSNAGNMQGKEGAKDSQNAQIKGTLEVKVICEKQGFTIRNFTNGDFGVHLSNNPTKEVAIVLNVNNSMWRYTNALKDIAPYLAKHILGEDSHKGGENSANHNRQFAKISLITFSYVRIYDLGTFYEPEEFAAALSRAKGTESNDKMVNVALIMAMANFTKDNGLKKEIYLITNGGADDSHKEEQMLQMTQNLNANIVKNTKTNADNAVKIHTFALKPFSSLQAHKANAEFLKNLARITGGSYNEADNAYNFKKQILTLSNGGKPFDMRELNNEIRPSKTHKIYDPNNP